MSRYDRDVVRREDNNDHRIDDCYSTCLVMCSGENIHQMNPTAIMIANKHISMQQTEHTEYVPITKRLENDQEKDTSAQHRLSRRSMRGYRWVIHLHHKLRPCISETKTATLPQHWIARVEIGRRRREWASELGPHGGMWRSRAGI